MGNTFQCSMAQVDWIDYFTMITSLGANFDQFAYLKPIAMDVPKL